MHAANNGLNGICVGSGSTVSGNTAYQNGRDGIQAGSGSAVQRNTVHLNGDYGISFVFPSNGAYRENVITGNAFGTVLDGVNRGDNYCIGTGVVSSFCP